MAWVRGATVEAFVPQMINFEVLGGVNFKKGCYPGQEIVARSQYRGTLKRRLQVFETDAAATVG
ncbi:CAF17-like 4Fe-4S cluster assembly/insertion protein YgfZ, partial [Clostridioides difficile]